MVDYYKALKVSPEASSAEIKSAYRKLARKIHPDVADRNEDTTREFASIVDAYKILGDSQSRAYYDRKRLKAEFSKQDSFFNVRNAHANRARQIIYERRYNAIIDRIIAEERKESMALQEIVFPIVSLFISTGFVAIFKPLFWAKSTIPGRIVLLTLFIVGVLHLLKRLHAGLERYTYSPETIHDSFFVEAEEETRSYSRLQVISFLICGVIVSLIIGLMISSIFGFMNTPLMSRIFSQSLTLELFFYPPIVVLLVDLIHRFASRVEY